MVPGAEASASPGSLLEMQTSGPTSDSLNQRLWLSPTLCVVTSPLGDPRLGDVSP